MNLLEEFGINPILLVAQIVNFLIILFVLRKFAYKPILSMLKKRKDTIEQGLKQAEESKLLLEQAEEKQDKIIRRAQEQAAKIIDDTRTQSRELSLELEEKARRQSDKIIEDARNQISQESKEAEKRLAAQINQMSISLIQKSLTGLFTKKEEEEVISKALRSIKKSD